MMSHDRVKLLLIDREDGLRTPGFTTPRALHPILDDTTELYDEPLSESSSSSTPTNSSWSSTGSSKRGDSGSVSSQSSSGSTAPSTAPSAIGPLQPLPAGLFLNPISTAPTPHLDHVLCCDFAFVGCTVRFHPNRYDDYLSHSISHFQGLPPPTKSVCIFCDDAVFKNIDNPEVAWGDRMQHISDHLQEPGHRFETARPDYFVIDYMWEMGENRLLSAEDFACLKSYTERTREQRCPDLLPVGEKPGEMKWKEERNAGHPHDLEKERRLMKKLKGARGTKGSEVWYVSCQSQTFFTVGGGEWISALP